MITEDKEKLSYKNSYVFYQTLYKRLFSLINDIINEKQFNINSIRDKVVDFTDSYSYYIIGKKPIKTKEKEDKQENDETLLDKIKSFDSFTSSLAGYPSKEYVKSRTELIKQGYDLSKLSQANFKIVLNEYYVFFDKVLDIIKEFIQVSSVNGFLPILKSKKSLRTIGFANYDLFFGELENLKLNLSSITTTIRINNMFKSRRCAYCILIVLSPYFKRKKLFNQFRKDLNFSFLNDESQIDIVRRFYQYDNLIDVPKNLRVEIEKIVEPFKINVCYIKRYISFELGEIDLSPKLKKKYLYDPTWT